MEGVDSTTTKNAKFAKRSSAQLSTAEDTADTEAIVSSGLNLLSSVSSVVESERVHCRNGERGRARGGRFVANGRAEAPLATRRRADRAANGTTSLRHRR